MVWYNMCKTYRHTWRPGGLGFDRPKSSSQPTPHDILEPLLKGVASSVVGLFSTPLTAFPPDARKVSYYPSPRYKHATMSA